MQIPKKKQENGFSFIELLVVIVIMALLFSLTSANYRDFQTRRSLDNAETLIKSDLRLVQEYARSGRKPETGCDVVLGYQLDFSGGSTYEIQADCSNGSVMVAEREIDNMTISPTTSGPDPVRFNVLGRGTNLSETDTYIIEITSPNSTENREISIEPGGNIE